MVKLIKYSSTQATAIFFFSADLTSELLKWKLDFFVVVVNSLKLSVFARFAKEQEKKSNSIGLIRATFILIPKRHTKRGQKCHSVRIIDIVAQHSA